MYIADSKIGWYDKHMSIRVKREQKSHEEEEKMFKIGVLGARRGSAFMRTLHYMKNAELTAVCEKDESALEEVKQWITDRVQVFTDYDEMLGSGIDGVILCNYFHEHADFAIKAFEAGVAVLSETTAAPTLGDCVRLVEACEKYNGTYMLAANCLYFNALAAMKKRIEEGETGKVMFGEAEYLHGPEGGRTPDAIKKVIDYDNLHWRKIMPPNMYNMHSLGPLMYVTGSDPVTVSCHMIRNAEWTEELGEARDCMGAVVVTEMNNGATFQTTGCNGYGPTSKWYRLACENGTMETKRYDAKEERLLIITSHQHTEDVWLSERQSGLIGAEDDINMDDVRGSGHGGIDYFVTYHFLKVLEKKEQPFFDVYRSAALSAVGILGWYSALMNSRRLQVPDFTKKEDRDRIRNDFRTPFAERGSKWWIPCRLDEKDKFTLELK